MSSLESSPPLVRVVLDERFGAALLGSFCIRLLRFVISNLLFPFYN